MLTTEKWHVRIFVTMVRHVGDVYCQFLDRNMLRLVLSLANVLDNFSFYFVFSIKNEGVIKFLQK